MCWRDPKKGPVTSAFLRLWVQIFKFFSWPWAGEDASFDQCFKGAPSSLDYGLIDMRFLLKQVHVTTESPITKCPIEFSIINCIQLTEAKHRRHVRRRQFNLFQGEKHRNQMKQVQKAGCSSKSLKSKSWCSWFFGEAASATLKHPYLISCFQLPFEYSRVSRVDSRALLMSKDTIETLKSRRPFHFRIRLYEKVI